MTGFNRVAISFMLIISVDVSALAQSPIISTYAGRSLPLSGEQATSYPIGEPSSVYPDAAGGFYFCSSNRVIRVNADGALTVISDAEGSGLSGGGGSAVAPELTGYGIVGDGQGNLFIADLSHSRIRKVTPAGVISTVAG